MPGDIYWTIDNEKAYIDSLISGTYRERPQLTAEEKLENYIRSAWKRIRWNTFGSVNGYEVVGYAKEQLKRLRGE